MLAAEPSKTTVGLVQINRPLDLSNQRFKRRRPNRGLTPAAATATPTAAGQRELFPYAGSVMLGTDTWMDREKHPMTRNRRREGRTAFLSLLAILLAFALVYKASAPDEPAEVATQSTIAIAQGVDAFSMDPTQHSVMATAAILFHIYDPLIIRLADGSLSPGLAESWVLEEPTRWRFNLRQGVEFTNGEPMNAEAVAFSINRAIDPATASPYAHRLSGIVEAVIVDEFTVDIFTAQPDPVLEQRLIQTSFPTLIVPPKHVKANDGIVPNDEPIGTGPYTFVEWVKGDHITMVSNPNYWGNELYWGDNPKPERLVWRPIPEVSASISALLNEEIEIAVDIPPERVQDIDDSDAAKSVETASDFIFFIALNTETVEAFQDVRVRQAMNFAVNVEEIIDELMLGFGTQISVSLPANGFGYPSDLEPYPFDPDKARKLLAEAGFADGFGPVVFKSRNGRYLKDAEIVQVVAGYLEDVGVKVEVQFVEGGVWGDLGNAHARGDLNFPGWSGFDPDFVWNAILRCGAFQSYFCNPELDALLDVGHTSIDKDVRAAAYEKAGALIFEQAPHIPLFQPPLLYGLSKNLNFTPSGDDLINLRGAFFAASDDATMSGL